MSLKSCKTSEVFVIIFAFSPPYFIVLPRWHSLARVSSKVCICSRTRTLTVRFAATTTTSKETEESDDRLFRKTLNNPYHTLHSPVTSDLLVTYHWHALLPPQSATLHHCHLRKRTHDRLLPAHRGHLLDENFVIRALYKDINFTENAIVCNCIGPILLISLVIACIVFNCVLPVYNKEYDDDDDVRSCDAKSVHASGLQTLKFHQNRMIFP